MDKYGPEKVLQVYQADSSSLGLLVIDNTLLGPGLGCIHFQKNVSLEEATNLARLHTLSCALHGLPFGGASACLAIGQDWKTDMRAFASAVSPFANSSFVAIPGSEIGQDEMEVYAYASGDVRSAAGKPPELKGIPFENGAVGLGVAHCAVEAMRFLRVGEGPSVSILGLGRDGLFAARVLSRSGVKITAIADLESATINKNGLDMESLTNLVRNRGRLDGFSRGEPATMRQAVLQPADAVVIFEKGFINRDLANDISPKLLVEGALGAVDLETESAFERRGTVVAPDVLACGGAHLSAHVERIGGNVVDMNDVVVKSMRRATMSVLEKEGRSLRECANEMAFSRLEEAKAKRRGSIGSDEK